MSVQQQFQHRFPTPHVIPITNVYVYVDIDCPHTRMYGPLY